jgi:hypothetical protein
MGDEGFDERSWNSTDSQAAVCVRRRFGDRDVWMGFILRKDLQTAVDPEDMPDHGFELDAWSARELGETLLGWSRGGWPAKTRKELQAELERLQDRETLHRLDDAVEKEGGGDKRFTLGLLVDVVEVLVRHGYPKPEGADLVRLELALFRFLYRGTKTETSP